MTRLRLIFIFMCLLTLAGCMTLPAKSGYRTYAAGMDKELFYRGFSVARPNDLKWYKVAGEDSHVSMIFRRETNSATHSCIAGVNLLQHPNSNMTHSEFESYIVSTITSYSARNKIVSYKTDRTTRQGQLAVEYFIEYEDNGAAIQGVKVLYAYMKGFAVLHPTLKGTYVDAHYSERGLREEVEAKILAASGDYFLEHLLIYDEPGKRTQQP